mgnify:CR=1 FL=1
MSKSKRLSLHLFALFLCVVLAAMLATWRGALWPFDPRATFLMTASGLLGIFSGWGILWLIPMILSVALTQSLWRSLLWIATVAAMVLLHGLVGPAQGFAPLSSITIPGAVWLYLIPSALCVIAGGIIRLTLSRSREFN